MKTYCKIRTLPRSKTCMLSQNAMGCGSEETTVSPAKSPLTRARTHTRTQPDRPPEKSRTNRARDPRQDPPWRQGRKVQRCPPAASPLRERDLPPEQPFCIYCWILVVHILCMVLSPFIYRVKATKRPPGSSFSLSTSEPVCTPPNQLRPGSWTLPAACLPSLTPQPEHTPASTDRKDGARGQEGSWWFGFKATTSTGNKRERKDQPRRNFSSPGHFCCDFPAPPLSWAELSHRGKAQSPAFLPKARSLQILKKGGALLCFSRAGNASGGMFCRALRGAQAHTALPGQPQPHQLVESTATPDNEKPFPQPSWVPHTARING